MQRQRSVDAIPIGIKDGKLVIRNIALESEDVVSYFEDVPESATLERFEQALEIGTTALRTMQTYENLNLIDKRFNQLSMAFETRLNQTLDGISKEVDGKFGEKGDVTMLIEKHFGKKGEVSSLVEGYFGEDGLFSKLLGDYFSEKGQLNDLVEKYFGPKGVFQEQAETFLGDKGKLRELLDPSRKGTPFYQLLEEIRSENQKLIERIILEKGKESLKDQTTLKGYEFEDECYEYLCAIARREKGGDAIEDVSEEQSKAVFGSKKGDFLISLGLTPGLRIVVEAKNWTNQLTMPEIKSMLGTAMKARNAQYALLIAKERNALPKFVGYFNEFDNMLLCALSKSGDATINQEIIDVAYKWAKLQVLRRNQESGQINAFELKKEIQSLKDELKGFQRILTQCDNIEDASMAIRKEGSGMKLRLLGKIESLSEKLSER